MTLRSKSGPILTVTGALQKVDRMAKALMLTDNKIDTQSANSINRFIEGPAKINLI